MDNTLSQPVKLIKDKDLNKQLNDRVMMKISLQKGKECIIARFPFYLYLDTAK